MTKEQALRLLPFLRDDVEKMSFFKTLHNGAHFWVNLIAVYTTLMIGGSVAYLSTIGGRDQSPLGKLRLSIMKSALRFTCKIGF